MRDIFNQYKILEQIELKNKEIKLLRDALIDTKQYFKDILQLKNRFTNNGKYHHILKTWSEDLDAIFNMAGKYMEK